MPEERIKIAKLATNKGLQMRVQYNDQKVEEYSERFDSSNKWPFDAKVQVIRTEEGENLVWDGFHRILGAAKAGKTSVECDVEEGTFEDALDLAYGANGNHGIHRNDQDVRSIVEKILQDDRHKKKGQRTLAGIVGISQGWFSKIKHRIERAKQEAEERKRKRESDKSKGDSEEDDESDSRNQSDQGGGTEEDDVVLPPLQETAVGEEIPEHEKRKRLDGIYGHIKKHLSTVRKLLLEASKVSKGLDALLDSDLYDDDQAAVTEAMDELMIQVRKVVQVEEAPTLEATS